MNFLEGLRSRVKGSSGAHVASRDQWSPEPLYFDGLVYTMGKVGSTTIHESLRSAGLYYAHLHRTSPRQVLKTFERQFKGEVPNLTQLGIRGLLAQDARMRGCSIRIISTIREPVARNLSGVFQNIKKGPLAPEDVVDAINSYGPNLPDKWFTQDFSPFTGIDWLNLNVDRKSDHFMITNENIHVLLLKIETGTARQESLISEFVGRPITLRSANVGGEKWYADEYRKAKREISAIAPEFVQKSLAQKYFTNFYSDAEIERVRARYGM